jgi:hypothetical protein
MYIRVLIRMYSSLRILTHAYNNGLKIEILRFLSISSL